mgnify:CR=1 FL=1
MHLLFIVRLRLINILISKDVWWEFNIIETSKYRKSFRQLRRGRLTFRSDAQLSKKTILLP